MQFDSTTLFPKEDWGPADVRGRGHIRHDSLTSLDLSKVARPLSHTQTKNETSRLNLTTKLLEAEEKRLEWIAKRQQRQQQEQRERRLQYEEAEYQHRFKAKLKAAEQEKQIKERQEIKALKEQKYIELREVKQQQALQAKKRLQDDLSRSFKQVKQNHKYRQEVRQTREAEKIEKRAYFTESLLTEKENKAAWKSQMKSDLRGTANLNIEADLVLALTKNQVALSRLMTMRSGTPLEGI
jgi:hypothetical protein